MAEKPPSPCLSPQELRVTESSRPPCVKARKTRSVSGIALAIILLVVSALGITTIIVGFVWAARKDGEEDRR